MSQPIMLELQLHEYLRERVSSDFPDIDEETLADTLEGLTSLHEKLSAVIRSQQDDRVMMDALKLRLTEMHDRIKRYEARFENKKELIATVMERADIRSIKEPDFTASLRATPRQLTLTDEEALPACYWRQRSPTLDRQRLLSDLNANLEVPGAMLGNGGVTVAVRVK